LLDNGQWIRDAASPKFFPEFVDIIAYFVY